MKRATVVAALNFFFRCLGLSEGNLRRQAGVGVKSRPELLAAVEICLRQIDGRELLGFDAFREFAYRQIINLFARHSRRSSGILWRISWFLCPRHRRGLPLPFDQWFKVKPGPVSVIRRKRSQTIERWLRFGDQSPDIGLLRVSEPAAVLSEDRPNP